MDIDWRKYESPEKLDAVLERFLAYPETQTFDDGEVGTREWLRLAKGERPITDLAWLLRQLDVFVPNDDRRRELYDAAAPRLIWRGGASDSMRIDRTLVGREIAFQQGDFRRVRRGASRLIGRRLAGIRRVKPAVGDRLIQTGVEALIMRGREVYAFSRGNEREVYVAPLGGGAEVVIVGVAPEARLVLEANYGYMIFKNGVAVGYGGVSPLFSQANTGVNIFEEYRGGESAVLFIGVLRAFHTLFGTTRFIASPYQFGEDNSEALQSGAFWFYHGLGFRLADRKLRRLAAAEAAKLARSRTYRSDRLTLRRLARADLHLTLGGRKRGGGFFAETGLGRLAAAVTHLLAVHKSSSRRAAAREVTARLARDLSVGAWSGWPAMERRSFERLAPLVALIPDVARWTARQRRCLVELMRAKGRPQERPYARLLARQLRLRGALKDVCRPASGRG